MSRPRVLPLLLLLFLIPGTTSVAGEEAEPPILPHAPLAVGPSRPHTAAHYRGIEALVAHLAGLDAWRTGLSPNSSGGPGFAADGSEGSLGAFLGRVSGTGIPKERAVTPAPADPDDASRLANEAFATLVALGAEAIPALLAHLDDETPTRLVFGQSGGFGATWMSTELDANPIQKDEIAAILAAFPGGWADEASRFEMDDFGREKTYLDRHVVTLGDCCFVLLGQITNRVYQALRYQPTMCHIVNSPTRDPRIARAVRNQWKGKDPRLELARRLMADLHTRKTGDYWSWLGERQASAARRLAYYHPEATEPLFVALVDRIEAKDAGEAEEATMDGDDLLEALVPSERPALRDAFRRLMFRTRKPDVFIAALPAVGAATDEALRARVLEMLDRAQTYWRRLRLSRELGRRWPEQLEAFLIDRMGSLVYAQVAAQLAYQDGVVLPVRAWRYPLQAELPAVPWTSTGSDNPLPLLRLCDVAAREIARQRPDLAFDENAGEAVRDAQILVIREVLETEKGR